MARPLSGGPGAQARIDGLNEPPDRVRAARQDGPDVAATAPRAPGDAHARPADEVAAALGVDPARGLSGPDAARRLAATGPNELERRKPISLLASIVDAATEPFVVLLAVAGALALALGEIRDGLLVLVGLIPIVGADVVTAYRSDRALDELREAAAPRAHVRRDGALAEIDARELVPGDVVLLRVGDVVPADLRIARAEALTLDRSVLTGESLPEEARVEADPPGTSLADRHALAYAGTSVVLGRGEGIVIATGAASELGRIATGLGPVRRGRSPLERELDRLVRILLVVAIGLIAITSGAALLRQETLGDAVLAGIAAAIAAIPEEPPVLLAVVLGLGAYRLLKRGVLVRRLNAQETLGAIDLIVTDKTGTLTSNRLSVEALLTPAGTVDDGARRSALLTLALRAEEDAWREGATGRSGSFARALRASLGDGSPVALDPADLVHAEPPRDGRPWSETVARTPTGEVETLALGAPEAVLAMMAGPTAPRAAASGPAAAMTSASAPAVSASALAPWHALVDASASAGRRLLLLGRRSTAAAAWAPEALIAFSDPIRPGVPEALRTATEAGIQTIVVTGDHPSTAATIARTAGLGSTRVATGQELDALDDEALRGAIGDLHVVARATPEQKLRIVEAARAARRTIAVTGDGVNDGPALQRADVGVAMGSGTAVAREASDLVLGDDSFATLMDGLGEGRRIVANVQKGLVFLTSTHVALLGFILIATLAGVAQPLLPIQILWLELFIDLSTSIAFEREPAEPDVMRRPPRPRDVPLLTNGLLVRIAVAGGLTAAAALAVTLWRGGGADHARWLAMTMLVFGQLVRAYWNRSLTHPIHRLARNGFLALACITVALIQLAIPWIGPLAEAFRATPLDALDLAIVALVAVGPAFVAETVRTRFGAAWVA